MVHRALLGSLERFFGILIEHYAGAFPLWLAPVQAVLIPVTDKQTAAAEEVAAKLRAKDFRVQVDGRPEKMGAKIRDAQMQKIPYMLVMGGREIENGTVSVRSRVAGDEGAMPLEAFIDKLDAERRVETKVLPEPLLPSAQNCKLVAPVAKVGLSSHWPVALNLYAGELAP
jgi:threonyl-tRNA synthetase